MYISYDNTKYLFYTSFLFLLTSILNLFNKEFYYSIFNFLLFLTSVLHWNDPYNIIFKTIDLFIVKVVGFFYLINSFYINEFDREFFTSIALCIIIFYFIEHVLDFYKNYQWIIFHMAIHIYGAYLFILFILL